MSLAIVFILVFLLPEFALAHHGGKVRQQGPIHIDGHQPNRVYGGSETILGCMGRGRVHVSSLPGPLAIGDQDSVNTTTPVYSFPVSQLCQQCHAEIAGEANWTACPACGGQLIPRPGPDLDAPGAPPRQVDRRGVLLPRRHAVGGVITPR